MGPDGHPDPGDDPGDMLPATGEGWFAMAAVFALALVGAKLFIQRGWATQRALSAKDALE